MKKLLSLSMAVISLLSLWGCKAVPPQAVASSDVALLLYHEFLSGEHDAKSENGIVQIADIFRGDEWNKYAFFDMNGDSIPELHVRSSGPYFIIMCWEGELIIWGGGWSYGCQPLNNGAILWERPGGANDTTSYSYQEFDFFGNEQLRVAFDSSITNDGVSVYSFEGETVTKDEWDTLTEKYFSIGSDKIEWFGFSE